MKRRRTVQKEVVWRAVQDLHQHVTADDVYSYIHLRHPHFSRGTVYRNLNVLCEEGEIRRVEIPDGPDRYDYLIDKHYHIHCVRCGRVFDADMAEGPAINTMIHDDHGFRLLDYDIIIKGICPDCLKEG